MAGKKAAQKLVKAQTKLAAAGVPAYSPAPARTPTGPTTFAQPDTPVLSKQQQKLQLKALPKDQRQAARQNLTIQNKQAQRDIVDARTKGTIGNPNMMPTQPQPISGNPALGPGRPSNQMFGLGPYNDAALRLSYGGAGPPAATGAQQGPLGAPGGFGGLGGPLPGFGGSGPQQMPGQYGAPMLNGQRPMPGQYGMPPGMQMPGQFGPPPGQQMPGMMHTMPFDPGAGAQQLPQVGGSAFGSLPQGLQQQLQQMRMNGGQPMQQQNPFMAGIVDPGMGHIPQQPGMSQLAFAQMLQGQPQMMGV